ncbi:hypothetical protein F5J12DRAFT_782760 [Pisolithus orientalis]|uniref:uncharacterized protein n=1 Tax=Pisolithus orientalis TaxID=936130 RepID=UPI002224F0D7|nr:uncharacterized protein F5J12DRAFT_782760 [Pisolithus orientalis]KAI6007787.1 hypothetical protein F5J12DRAFT_782760 [Pisolithus orientalis]
MAGCRTSSRRSPAAADVITYRLEDKMMYVPLDHDWREALSQARLTDSEGRIGISPSAWSSVASHLTRYEVITIVVKPEVVGADAEVAPPVYSLASSAPEEKRSLSSTSLGSRSESKFSLKGVLQALRKE